MFQKSKFNVKVVLIVFLAIFICYNFFSEDKKVEQPTPETKKVETQQNKPETQKPTPVNYENLKGRGFSDNGREEPKYVGVKGYVVVSLNDYNLAHSENSLNGNWTIPTYQQDKQFWNETGQFLNHKTEVTVKKQILQHEGYGGYSGYLLESVYTR